MKKITLLMISFFLLCFIACDSLENDMDDSNVIVETIPHAMSINSKLSTFANPSSYNQGLESDWENLTLIKLNNGDKVVAPWVENINNVNTVDISDAIRLDVSKADGWRLLAHTVNGYQDANYIIFYNKYRGLLKGFYYNKDANPGANFTWELTASNPTKLLTAPYIRPNSENKHHYTITSNRNKHKSNNTYIENPLVPGWNAFSLELGYGDIPDLITISGWDVSTSQLNLNGSLKGSVDIPKETTRTPFSKTLSFLKSLIGGVGSVVPGFSGVSQIITSSISGLSEINTFFNAKKGISYVQANFAGTVNLEGNSTLQTGARINNIEIRLKNILDSNEYLGVWSMPDLNVTITNLLMPKGGDSTIIEGYLQVNPLNNLKNLIQINPNLLNEIENVEVSSFGTYVLSQQRTPFISEKVGNDYITNLDARWLNSSYSMIPFSKYTLHGGCYIYNGIPPIVAISILVDIKYKNGFELNSSRLVSVGKVTVKKLS